VRLQGEVRLTSNVERAPLTNNPSALGLDCTLSGLWLAGVPLLRRTEDGFTVRPSGEIAELMKSAYGRDVELPWVSPGLDVAAIALNRGDLGRAMVAAARLGLPKLNWNQAAQMARAEYRLTKYNQTELRDWRGRWTTGGGSSSPSSSEPGHSPPAARRQAARVGFLGSTPARIAGAEELIGGGPEDVIADAAAAATLAAGFLLSLIAANRSRSTTAAASNGRRNSRRAQASSRKFDEDDCEELLNKDMINCQIVKSVRGAQKGAQCRAVANVRYSECLRGGPSNVHTPLYWGN
jgi:hypothetical protein